MPDPSPLNYASQGTIPPSSNGIHTLTVLAVACVGFAWTSVLVLRNGLEYYAIPEATAGLALAAISVMHPGRQLPERVGLWITAILAGMLLLLMR